MVTHAEPLSHELVDQARELRVAVRFDYTDLTGEHTNRTVIPYPGVASSESSFLGHCTTREDVRQFSFARMANATLAPIPLTDS